MAVATSKKSTGEAMAGAARSAPPRDRISVRWLQSMIDRGDVTLKRQKNGKYLWEGGGFDKGMTATDMSLLFEELDRTFPARSGTGVRPAEGAKPARARKPRKSQPASAGS